MKMKSRGTVERFDNRFIYVNLVRSKHNCLSKEFQIPGEVFQSHDRTVFVYKAEDN